MAARNFDAPREGHVRYRIEVREDLVADHEWRGQACDPDEAATFAVDAVRAAVNAAPWPAPEGSASIQWGAPRSSQLEPASVTKLPGADYSVVVQEALDADHVFTVDAIDAQTAKGLATSAFYLERHKRIWQLRQRVTGVTWGHPELSRDGKAFLVGDAEAVDKDR